jgi:hypothetical protein
LERKLSLRREAEMASVMAREVSGKTRKVTRSEEVMLKQIVKKTIRASVSVLVDLTETSNSIRKRRPMVATTLDTRKRASHPSLLLLVEAENLIVVKADPRVSEERRVHLAPR